MSYCVVSTSCDCYYFFFNDTATTEIYTYCHTLSLHDALPICLVLVLRRLLVRRASSWRRLPWLPWPRPSWRHGPRSCCRSEEHTSELQSLMRISYAVFCLKKKKRQKQ